MTQTESWMDGKDLMTFCHKRFDDILPLRFDDILPFICKMKTWVL